MFHGVYGYGLFFSRKVSPCGGCLCCGYLWAMCDTVSGVSAGGWPIAFFRGDVSATWVVLCCRVAGWPIALPIARRHGLDGGSGV